LPAEEWQFSALGQRGDRETRQGDGPLAGLTVGVVKTNQALPLYANDLPAHRDHARVFIEV
jgi:hypothetical protein